MFTVNFDVYTKSLDAVISVVDAANISNKTNISFNTCYDAALGGKYFNVMGEVKYGDKALAVIASSDEGVFVKDPYGAWSHE